MGSASTEDKMFEGRSGVALKINWEDKYCKIVVIVCSSWNSSKERRPSLRNIRDCQLFCCWPSNKYYDYFYLDFT